MTGESSRIDRLRTLTERLGYRAYDGVTRVNYDRELLARRNRTPAGSFACYELLPRHRRDAMLAEVNDVCDESAVLYDIGASVGIYALGVTSDAPKRQIIAFEPSPPIVDRMRTNVRLNDRADRIDVLACGLGDETATRPLYVSTYPELSGFDRESATRWGASVASVTPVECYRLDDLVENLPPPDVCKLDVEGTAPAVLRGARETLARHRPTTFIEIHTDGLTADVPAETRSVLDELDYRIHSDGRDGYWRCEPR